LAAHKYEDDKQALRGIVAPGAICQFLLADDHNPLAFAVDASLAAVHPIKSSLLQQPVCPFARLSPEPLKIAAFVEVCASRRAPERRPPFRERRPPFRMKRAVGWLVGEGGK